MPNPVPIPAALVATFDSKCPAAISDSSEALPTSDLAPPSEIAVLYDQQTAARAAAKHSQTLMASRVRKFPQKPPLLTAATAVGEESRRYTANLKELHKWITGRSGIVELLRSMPTTPSGQNDWIRHCDVDLAALVKSLPFTITYVKGLTRMSRKRFGPAINCEAQLAVIRRYAQHEEFFVRKFCIVWDAVASQQQGAIKWKTTDLIQRWKKVHKLHPQLLCATVVDPIMIDEWGILNVICLMLPYLTPVDNSTAVVM
ncbi:unnamed protein product [Hyaloperonospora brassicae]|uniref:Uncharacterized protein n=1 Tax=Hyaloperonospora brassicae TaxID=162125 RepID=A0AAV0V5T7_HYABA|nr:unnamed protein product [Hyaloperonospora brassicae]